MRLAIGFGVALWMSLLAITPPAEAQTKLPWVTAAQAFTAGIGLVVGLWP